VAAGKRAVGEPLLRLQVAFQQNARLGVQLGLGQIHVSGCNLRKLPVDDLPITRNHWAFAAAGIDGDNLGRHRSASQQYCQRGTGSGAAQGSAQAADSD
jgi:hypothetical protein